ncbi:MAG: protein kinase, partial [Rhodocyclaceae bacterium]|nr:protein kinase [Rhodocyclaceae bacterium]
MVAEALPEKIGECEVLEELGRGATSVVYRVRHPAHEVPVALKYVQFSAGQERGKSRRRLLKLLKAEEYTAQRLQHPSIIRIYEVVVNQDDAWVVMEYFDGRSLEEFCAPDRLLPVARVVALVLKCCVALGYAHSQGVVHRDIKPANVLIDEEDNVKISDFGLALHLNRVAGEESTAITGVGSPSFMSPEQIKGHPLNEQTDIYSLGVMLFYLLTGRLPFRAVNAAELMFQVINAEAPSVTALNPSLPPQMEAIVRKTLAKDQFSRYKHAADLAKDLSSLHFNVEQSQKQVTVEDSRFKALRAMPLLEGLEDVQVWELTRIAAWRDVKEGESIYAPTRTDTRFSLLVRGAVAMQAGERQVERYGRGELFGELPMLLGARMPCEASWVALEASCHAQFNPSALAL